MHPLNEYYKLLGLSSSASNKDIRKRYRKLALKYHPDKNTEPLAHEKFILINEAYEIITGKKKAPNKYTTTAKTTKQSDKENNWEERIIKARQRYEKNKAYEEKMILKYFVSLRSGWRWKVIKLLCIVSSFVAFSMILDVFLPHHFVKENVQYYMLNCLRKLITILFKGKIQHSWRRSYFINNYFKKKKIMGGKHSLSSLSI